MTAHLISASSAKVATGSATDNPVPPGAEHISVLVDVTAVSGTTPSMGLTIQWSHDGVTYAGSDVADAFNAITTTTTKVRRFEVKGSSYRVTWVLTGTSPSFTFSATGFASD